MTESLSWWSWVRALLLTFVMFFSVVEAMPAPNLKKQHLNREMASEEIEGWLGLLGSVGIEMTREELIELTVSVGGSIRSVRTWVISPYRKFEKLFGLSQRWGLFTYVNTYPGRLVVEVAGPDDDWRERFRAPESDGSRLVRTLQYRRIRAVWDGAGDRPHPGALYNHWVDWFAGRVFAEDPDVDRVRVYFERLVVRSPGKAQSDEPLKKLGKRERFRDGEP